MEESIEEFVAKVVRLDNVEESFNQLVVHRPDDPNTMSQGLAQRWVRLLKDVSATASASANANSTASGGNPVEEAIKIALKIFVSTMSKQKKKSTLDTMKMLLERSVRERAASASQVCTALLQSEALRPDAKEFWCTTFSLVRSIIGGVYYKGVREIMKNCIDKVQTIPDKVSPEVSEQLTAIQDLLQYIFDRNAALLPGYFIVNEILKSYPENPGWPHWALVPLVSKFLNSFRTTAQMVTITNRARLRPIIEHIGRSHIVQAWKIDPHSLKIMLINQSLDRVLPFCADITAPQREILQYALRQPHAKDFVGQLLGIQKPRKDAGQTGAQLGYPALEEELVHMFYTAMLEAELERSETEMTILWRSLSSELIFFVLFQYINFGKFVESLSNKLLNSKRKLRKGRDNLMWTILQFISGSISKNTTSEFIPALKLFGLYDEPKSLPVPSPESGDSVLKLAAAAVFIHLNYKSQADNIHLRVHIPVALERHVSFLEKISMEIGADSTKLLDCLDNSQSLLVPILCNTFSTYQNETSQRPMNALLRRIGADPTSEELDPSNTVPMPGGSPCVAINKTEPLSMKVLDSLTVHAKMSLIHNIVTYIVKQINGKQSVSFAPALVETHCRLLIYPEIETLGFKTFINQLLPQVKTTGSWKILYTLMEQFAHRLNHLQGQFRISLLSYLQMNLVYGGGGTGTATHQVLSKHVQLNLAIENTTLRLISGLGNAEISSAIKSGYLSHQQGQQLKAGSVLYGDCEELNRVLVLTLARAIRINGLEQQSGQWVMETLTNIMTRTPHTWPSHTLQHFPQIIQDFFKESSPPKVDKTALMQKVEEEYKIWTSMAAEQDRLYQHFANTTTSLNGGNIFLCVLWKVILDTETIPPVAYKILDRLTYKQFSCHLRSFCDLLVHEFGKSGRSGHVSKCIQTLIALIWKQKIISLDRLILTMLVRTYEGNDAQVCFFVIQILLLQPEEVRSRVQMISSMSPEHQLLKDFHASHLKFHNKFPEWFAPEECPGMNGATGSMQQQTSQLPTYFGNVCLRFVPVFDIVVHRFLELPQMNQSPASLMLLLDRVGLLYKFHPQPITYLYNTLHYYEKMVREQPMVKRKLIQSVADALSSVRPKTGYWFLTDNFLKHYITVNEEEAGKWNPGPDYFITLVGRLTRAMSDKWTGKRPFPEMDWRFNEFSNVGVHALYVTCVEIMGLSGDPTQIGTALLDVLLIQYHVIPREELPEWINSIGLILSSLPEAYWEGLYQKLVAALSSPPLVPWTLQIDPFKLFNFDHACELNEARAPIHLSFLLALAHAVFHHAGFAQLQTLPDLMREKLAPLVKTEEQLLFILHLTGPFLQRLHSERYMRPLFDLTIQFYRMLARVDKEIKHWKHADAICDILYHVKYQFTGDFVKADASRVVKDLSTPLQVRLRFIAPGIVTQ